MVASTRKLTGVVTLQLAKHPRDQVLKRLRDGGVFDCVELGAPWHFNYRHLADGDPSAGTTGEQERQKLKDELGDLDFTQIAFHPKTKALNTSVIHDGYADGLGELTPQRIRLRSR